MLSDVFERCVAKSPISVMVRATLERELGADRLDLKHARSYWTLGLDVLAFGPLVWSELLAYVHQDIYRSPRYARTIYRLGQSRTIRNLREIFEVQMQAQYFPVQLDHMGATFGFLHIDKASEHFTNVNNTITTVTANRHSHPGGSYGYRVERDGKVLVFCTDIEHGDRIDQQEVELGRGADLLVHEAQYTTEELKIKKGWGHSSYDMIKRSRWRRWLA
jgi:ribonuclease BN (tRNA processing enzyme)